MITVHCDLSYVNVMRNFEEKYQPVFVYFKSFSNIVVF